MKKLKTLLLAGLVVAGLTMVLNTDTAKAYTCLTPSTAKPDIKVSGNTATAHFTLPSGCKNINVTFVSYKAPNGTDGKPYAQQVLFTSVTRNYNVEGRREIKIALPDCFYQVDLVIGQPLQSFAGGATYHGEHRFLDARHGGSKSCTPAQTVQPAPPAPAPAAETPAVNITNTNTNTNTNTAVASNTVTTPQPTTTSAAPEPAPAKEETPAPGKLPDTGPGTLTAFGFGSTFMSSLLYAYRGRYTDLLDRLLFRFKL